MKKKMKEQEIYKFSKEYAKKAGFALNKNKKQLSYVIKGLKKNEDKYGFRFCPCRIVTGNFEEDRIIVCPCIYHKQEIKDQGHCLCNLFFDKDYEKKFGAVKTKELESWVNKSLAAKAKKDNASFVLDRFEAQRPQCFFGYSGICCKNCNMGPCRITPRAATGVCGATADVIAARNLLRTISAGACCHVEHARENALTLLKVGEGKTKAYSVKDKEKLNQIEKKLGKKSKNLNETAVNVALEAFEDFRRQHGVFHRSEGSYLNWLKINAPNYLQELWKKIDILPENADIETTRSMHATTMGNDTDPRSLLLQCLKLGLVDGYAGLRMATDMQDILFGTPHLIKAEANLGTLKTDFVNIAMHGHIPLLSEKILEWSKKLEKEALKQGAKGINIVGVCCTGNELTERHGIALTAHTVQSELVLVTGAVEAMIVDAQCIYPSLAAVASCYHTKLITTMIAKMPGALHIPFKIEDADKIAEKIVKIAIDNFKNRNKAKVLIPKEKTELYSGFSVEQIIEALGKLNKKEPLNPLVDNIKSGNIKGIVAIIGCRNPKLRGKKFAETLIKELLKENILVVTTGCIAHASAQEGLMKPEAVKYCGNKLKAVLEAIGKANDLPSLPPVLHMGSCVDNSRIINLVSEISNYTKIPISKLPIAASAPELVTEKAVSIGTNALAHGIAVHINPPLWIAGAPWVTKVLTKDLEKITGGKVLNGESPKEAAKAIIEHIENKRKELKI
ncbi:carbon-monoxide dehydrogenase catalytic subunit [Candidatus Pacearchaeota archaeon CG06_land_8_20_14_3_00_35_12]|nr:MAG: carbon-monoxide dehydrogenase catalytic subunit [Candidatus Pacearchaeota archaeon CG06_land_8_20_14_3_00_35_12]